jgi:hypothetical protein
MGDRGCSRPGLAGRGHEYMERYVHQHQIREAAGRPRLSAELTGPVLTTAAHSLPVALAPVPRPEGAVVSFTAEGDGGRTWHLVMAAEGWDLRVGLPLGPAACAAATTVDGAIKLYARDPPHRR